MKAMLAPWALALAGCASAPASESPLRHEAKSQIVESVEDLVMLSSTASFEEVAALFGPLPTEDSPPYHAKFGPFPTGQNAFIAGVNFNRSGGEWNIAVNLLRPHLAGCFAMDRLPEMVGATEGRRPSHSESDYFYLRAPEMTTEFRSFPGRFSYMCLETITFRRVD